MCIWYTGLENRWYCSILTRIIVKLHGLFTYKVLNERWLTAINRVHARKTSSHLGVLTSYTRPWNCLQCFFYCFVLLKWQWLLIKMTDRFLGWGEELGYKTVNGKVYKTERVRKRTYGNAASRRWHGASPQVHNGFLTRARSVLDRVLFVQKCLTEFDGIIIKSHLNKLYTQRLNRAETVFARIISNYQMIQYNIR